IVVFGSDLFGSDSVSDSEDDKSEEEVINKKSDRESKKLKRLNTEIVSDLILWAFGVRGQMRARNLQYTLLSENLTNPDELTINDVIDFEITLEVFDDKKKQWIGWNADDVQLTFAMLTPRMRKTLKSTGNGKHVLTFRTPDVFGVYKFIVDYHARGYKPINISQQVSLHPLRHDQRPRFVTSAYPFYTVCFIMCIAVLVISVLFVSLAPDYKSIPTNEEKKQKDEQKKDKKEKEKEKEKDNKDQDKDKDIKKNKKDKGPQKQEEELLKSGDKKVEKKISGSSEDSKPKQDKAKTQEKKSSSQDPKKNVKEVDKKNKKPKSE
ncbi:MAG: putative Dolichyl-diphosphooligosaccharide--protein glycosyltransferase 48 kDa subunit, partial [Streblomastix strix]